MINITKYKEFDLKFLWMHYVNVSYEKKVTERERG
jgi:hypothetical protein